MVDSIVGRLMRSDEAKALKPECRDALFLMLDAAVNKNPLKRDEAVKLLRLAADLYSGVEALKATPCR